MQKLALRFSKFFVVASLVSFNLFAMEQVPAAVQEVVTNVVAPVVPSAIATAEKMTNNVPGAIEQGKELVKDIANKVVDGFVCTAPKAESSASAVTAAPAVQPAAPAVVPAAPATPAPVAPAAPAAIVQPAAKPALTQLPIEPIQLNKKAGFSFKESWNNLVNNVGAKKAELITYASSIKARGWHGLTRNEKVAFVAAGTVAAAAITYGVYKIYKSYTNKNKQK